MGGDLKVTSAINQGTTFTISMSLMCKGEPIVAQEVWSLASEIVQIQTDGEKPKILLAYNSWFVLLAY